jgi:CheY-like chemotaxis protein
MPVVLVVEDDPDIRATMCEALQDHGYTAVGAANGALALDYLRGGNARPSVILLDLMMPVMDGRTFRAEQRADPAIASIPVIVISAYRDVGRHAAELDADYLQKPIRLDTLLEAARRHCDTAS